MWVKAAINAALIAWYAFGCLSIVGYVDGFISDDSLPQVAASILKNDTVLQTLLIRYPDLYYMLMQTVNAAILGNATLKINEQSICNVARSIFDAEDDKCLSEDKHPSSECYDTKNLTEVAANTSLNQLCSNISADELHTRASSTDKSTKPSINSYETPVAPPTTFPAPRSTKSGNVTTVSYAVTEKPTDPPLNITAFKLQETATNISTAIITPIFTTVPTDVPTTDIQTTDVAPMPPAPPSDINAPSSYLFLAIQLAARTAIVSFERSCRKRNGTFVKRNLICVIANQNGSNGTSNYTLRYKPESRGGLKLLNMVGNCCSIAAIVLLFGEYFSCKVKFTLFEKCIISLAVSLLASHLMQLLITFFGDGGKFCKVSGILLHWALLGSFIWMSVISWDIFKTFSRTQRRDSEKSKQKYVKYLIIVTSASTGVILTCIFMGIPAADYSGYGYEGKCFVGKFWANVFSFIAPVGLSLLFNTVFMIITLLSIRKMQNRAAVAFASNASQRSGTRKQALTSVLTLKLSVLFGLGWFIGFINAISNAPVLDYVFTGIVSLQGLLVSLCFGSHKEFYKACRARLVTYDQRSLQNIKTSKSNATTTTQL